MKTPFVSAPFGTLSRGDSAGAFPAPLAVGLWTMQGGVLLRGLAGIAPDLASSRLRSGDRHGALLPFLTWVSPVLAEADKGDPWTLLL